jgi:hypothetical protein
LDLNLRALSLVSSYMVRRIVAATLGLAICFAPSLLSAQGVNCETASDVVKAMLCGDKNAEPKAAPTPDPSPVNTITSPDCDIYGFLTRIEAMVRTQNPHPFDKYRADEVVKSLSQGNAYFLLIPDAYAPSDVSLDRIKSRLDVIIPELKPWVEACRNTSITIEVHADGALVTSKVPNPSCPFKDNSGLTACRAKEIEKYLSAKGLAGIKVEPKGDREALCFKKKPSCEETEVRFDRNIRVSVRKTN